MLAFSKSPSDEELSHLPFLRAALLPVGAKTEFARAENDELARALHTYVEARDTEEQGPLEKFVAARPNSRWRASLLLAMGRTYREYGYISRALACWREAWDSTKNSADSNARVIASEVAGDLADLVGRLGGTDELAQLFAEVGDLPVTGTSRVRLDDARDGLWMMHNRPGVAFKCGPWALSRILAIESSARIFDPIIVDAQSTASGFSLAQVFKLSERLQMGLQLAKRDPGAEVIIPSVAHWRAGHFSALVRRAGAAKPTYVSQDPTFDRDFRLSVRAIDDEASGYFLVPAGALPAGWRPVSFDEARAIWGKGFVTSADPTQTKPCDVKAKAGCSPCGSATGVSGMPEVNVHSLRASLNITDTPVGYQPAAGPSVFFTVTNNSREDSVAFGFDMDRGPWMHNWESFVAWNPGISHFPDYTSDVEVFVRGGGRERYTGFTATGVDPVDPPGAGTTSPIGYYAQPRQSQAKLVRTSNFPTRFERTLPDGSVEVYGQESWELGPYSSADYQKVYLTQVKTPQGHTITLDYVANSWLTKAKVAKITDAAGGETTFTYTPGSGSTDTLRVTDPYGRYAEMIRKVDSFPGNYRIESITDTIGLTTSFTYAAGGVADPVTAMTTPYQTAPATAAIYHFTSGGSGVNRWVEIEDPYGDKERVETRVETSGFGSGEAVPQMPPGEPAASTEFLYYRNTFYWDKKQYAQALPVPPATQFDYTKARVTHWLHAANTANAASGIVESEKEPLESRVWYRYSGQPAVYTEGTMAKPKIIARVVEDANGTATTERWEYLYNDLGMVTQAKDPNGRITKYEYASNNIDLVSVKQVIGANPTTDVVEVAHYDWVAGQPHLLWKARDAALQTTEYTYNTAKLLTSIKNAKNEVTSFTYYGPGTTIDKRGRLSAVTGHTFNSATGPVTTLDYDNGQVTSVTNTDGYTVAIARDNMDRPTLVTYPDTTTVDIEYDRLDLWKITDREGSVTEYKHDAIRRLTSVKDPLLHETTYTWCDCGSVATMTDANGNETTWDYDVQGRLTKKILDDLTETEYIYWPSSGRLKDVEDSVTGADAATPQVMRYKYFVGGNLSSISYINEKFSTPDVSLTYGQYFDRRDSMTTGTEVTTYGYQDVGSPGALQLETIDGPFANDTIAYTFDELGRALSRSIGGVSLSLEYDSLGRVTEETNALGTFNFTYDDLTSRLETVLYPEDRNSNRQATTYTYYGNVDTGGGDRRLKNIEHVTANGDPMYDFDHRYSADGTLTWIGVSPQNYTGYGYDAANQLATVFEPLLELYEFTYDAAGNRTAEQVNDTTTTTSVFSSTNQLTSQSGGVTRTLTYDGNGSQLTKGSRSYEWDGAHRLRKVTIGTQTTEISYDGEGRFTRILDKDGGVTMSDLRYVWSGSQICEERDATGATVYRRFFSLGEQIAGGGDVFYARDHLGSITHATDALTGDLLESYEYDPYGRTADKPSYFAPAFGYAGYFQHFATDLNFTMYRAYDPDLGRWLSRDPLGEAGGINLYGYVGNDPMNSVDRLGLQPSCIPFETAHNGLGRFVPSTSAMSRGVEAMAFRALGVYVHFAGLFYGPIGEQAGGAVSDFTSAYADMVEANHRSSDKYFHCLANCRAAQRSDVGGLVGGLISEGREWFDWGIKGDSTKDCTADMCANYEGLHGGRGNSIPCQSVCSEYRPNGLPTQY